MKYNEFISMIKRTQSQFGQTRKTAMRNLRIFWEEDSGQMFEKFMERMSFELEENTRQRWNMNRWN